MSALTTDERALLATIRQGRTPTGCPCMPDWGQAVADHVRSRVPEIDDVTLARVVLAVSSQINALTIGHGMRVALHASTVLAEAATELAALDLDHPTTDTENE